MLAAAAFAFCWGARAEVPLLRVQGLSYSAEGQRLMVAGGAGLAAYSGGRWSSVGPAHGLSGLAVAREATYASGSVALRALQKSTDGGRTWHALLREPGVRAVAASFAAGAVYVLTTDPEGAMPELRLRYTLDGGASWKHATAAGLAGRIAALAVHPLDPRRVAVATDGGAFLSRDHAMSFTPVAAGPATSVHFDFDGAQLWVARDVPNPGLLRIALETLRQHAVRLPPMPSDAVSHIAQSPVRKSEIAVGTFGGSIYVSPDDGRTWRQIALEGDTRVAE